MKRWLALQMAVSLLTGFVWWLSGPSPAALVLGILAIFVLPGQTWRASAGNSSALGAAIDGIWISLVSAWLGLAVARELRNLGLFANDGPFLVVLLGMASGCALVGTLLAPKEVPSPSLARSERLGLGLLVLALVGLSVWRKADLERPLSNYWWHGLADRAGVHGGELPPLQGVDWGEEVQAKGVLDLLPGAGWSHIRGLGWAEAGAWELSAPSDARLESLSGTQGLAIVLMSGPVGSTVRVSDDQGGTWQATVERAPTERAEEGPVVRYRNWGMASLALPVDLAAGEGLVVSAEGRTVYLLSGPEAVWSAHAEGTIRFTHYYQILNQVENLDWAAELRDRRRFTWNQPPGWSPLLAIAGLLWTDDLPANGLVFLGVLGLVGASALRLLLVLAPETTGPALALPAGLMAAHGLLMLEPGSQNFPDSLYAAAMVNVALTFSEPRRRASGLFVVLAQALRWPGTVFSLLLAGGLAIREERSWNQAVKRIIPALPWMGGGLGLGLLVSALAVWSGDAEDLLFILYFETFPEHWHDNYALMDLLPRAPDFYRNWLYYTGGGLLLCVWGLIGAPNPARRKAQGLFIGMLGYSFILATIDHHPTHYFLPLVALTGPVLGASVAEDRLRRRILPMLCLGGILVLLERGQVW
jgi:hypothetical protein